MTPSPPVARTSTVLRLICVLPYALAIFAIVYAARYGYPQTDDYCTFGRLIRQHDANPFVETWHLYTNWTGRYSSSFLVAFAGFLTTILPVSVHAVYAGFLMAILGVFLFAAWRISGWMSNTARSSIVVALVLAAVPLVVMPSKLESLYWLTGGAVYFAGIASLLLTAYSTLTDTYTDRVGQAVPTYSWATIAGIVLTVGFNEFLAIALGGFLVLRALLETPARAYLKQNIAYLLAFGIAFVVTVAAPGNFARDAGLATERHHLGPALALTARSWHVFLQMHVVPHKALLAAIALASLAAGWIASERLSSMRIRRFFPLPVALVGSFPLHFFVYSFLSGEETPGRIVNQAYPLALIGVMLVLAWGAARVRHYRNPPLLNALAWTATLACGVVLLASGPMRALIVEARDFGPIWEGEQDARERVLIKASRTGQPATVRAFTPENASPPIFEGADISGDPANWVNQCVAGYFGVPQATAAMPTPPAAP